MAYKNLVVVLDADQSSRERISYAAALAARFDAHLVGLYLTVSSLTRDEYALLDIGVFDMSFFSDPAKSRAESEKTRALFEEVMAREGVSAEWRTVSGYPAGMAAMHGRYADLIVIGQLDAYDSQAGLLRARPEEVTMLAGRPVLVVPFTGHFERIGTRVLVGWDASREAARAVRDAMPLLARAEAVTVLVIDAEQSPFGHGDIPGADIALYLARHGVKAEVERTVSSGIGIGNTLLSRAADYGADLLVMGAYGHSRVRELLLGGATRTVLQSMTLPVRMSH
jgi:nucleotide-binding universal stress UspA family protein